MLLKSVSYCYCYCSMTIGYFVLRMEPYCVGLGLNLCSCCQVKKGRPVAEGG